MQKHGLVRDTAKSTSPWFVKWTKWDYLSSCFFFMSCTLLGRWILAFIHHAARCLGCVCVNVLDRP